MVEGGLIYLSTYVDITFAWTFYQITIYKTVVKELAFNFLHKNAVKLRPVNLNLLL